MISRSIHQEDTTILNVYVMPNNTASKHMAKTDKTVGRMNKSIIIDRDFSTPTWTHRQKFLSDSHLEQHYQPT